MGWRLLDSPAWWAWDPGIVSSSTWFLGRVEWTWVRLAWGGGFSALLTGGRACLGLVIGDCENEAAGERRRRWVGGGWWVVGLDGMYLLAARSSEGRDGSCTAAWDMQVEYGEAEECGEDGLRWLLGRCEVMERVIRRIVEYVVV